MENDNWAENLLSGFDNVQRMPDGCRSTTKIKNNVPKPIMRNFDLDREAFVVASIVAEGGTTAVAGEIGVVGDVNITPMRAVNDNNVSLI